MKNYSFIPFILILAAVFVLASCSQPLSQAPLAQVPAITSTPVDPTSTYSPPETGSTGIPTECVLNTNTIQLPVTQGCSISLNGSKDLTVGAKDNGSYSCSFTGGKPAFAQISSGTSQKFTLDGSSATLTCNNISYRINQ